MEQSAGAGMPIFFILIGLAAYIYVAYCFFVLAKKTGHEAHAFWSWIPVVNIFLMIEIAGKPWWWFFLLIIPLVNIVFIVWLWAEICKTRNVSPWFAALILIPIASLVLPGYLAFKK